MEYTTTVTIPKTPTTFYRVVDLMTETRETLGEKFEQYLDLIGKSCADIDDEVRELEESHSALLNEIKKTSRKKMGTGNAFDFGGDDDILGQLRGSGQNFLTILLHVLKGIQEAHHNIRTMADQMRPQPITLGSTRVPAVPNSSDEFQTFMYQVGMNEDALRSFIGGIFHAEQARNHVVEVARRVASLLDAYYATLVHRHSVQGIQIHGDPISTDLAIAIYENVDANGEIEDGRSPDEISAYSMNKGILIAQSAQSTRIQAFIDDPAALTEFLVENLQALWNHAAAMEEFAKKIAVSLREVFRMTWAAPKGITDGAFKLALGLVKDMDPQNVEFREKTKLMSREERKALQFRNDTLRKIVGLLQSDSSPEMIVHEILTRKKELRDYMLGENSFFVCKIGSGNPFGGEAPGALKVEPGTKPNVDLSEVRGSGFDEVRDFIAHMGQKLKWQNLFLATSPSGKASKGNVLLIGPMGCGKTEALRAVASDRNSVSIFAIASDFNTCWMGEMEKNPKRMFEAGLKIQRDSDKQVYFLIDEIDELFAQNDRTKPNLSTEFQSLMDGIMDYPHLAVWGATNHPDRIPMPLIRRFAKVVIVGELTQDDRVGLLQDFAQWLPLAEDFSPQVWQDAATRLEGATGDIVRKVVDHVWRTQMDVLTSQHPGQAERLSKMLEEGGEAFDVAIFRKDDSMRQRLLRELRSFFVVKPEHVMESVETNLGNVAIQKEIHTAIETYERAREMLQGMRKGI